jgi:hypothetical protein
MAGPQRKSQKKASGFLNEKIDSVAADFTNAVRSWTVCARGGGQ